MSNVLLIVQILIGLALIIAILLQVQGKGFGRVIGSGGTSFTRRGLEKIVFKLTFVLTFLFIIVSIAELLI